MNDKAVQPLVIDLEASGLGRGSYPIEVGIALADGSSCCTLIYPDDHWQHWDHQAQQLHGIPRSLLLTHGRSLVEVAQLLNQWVDGRVVYSDAWGNDSSWLGLLFECAEVVQHFKLDSLRSIMSQAQADIWHQVKAQVIEDFGFQRHRASNDARILQQTYQRTLHLTDAQPR